MSDKENRKLKNVSFSLTNESDQEMLKFIDETGMTFGTYVKTLIRNDMKKNNSGCNSNELRAIAEAINSLKEYLKPNNLEQKEEFTNNDVDADVKEYDESRNIVSNILNMGKNN